MYHLAPGRVKLVIFLILLYANAVRQSVQWFGFIFFSRDYSLKGYSEGVVLIIVGRGPPHSVRGDSLECVLIVPRAWTCGSNTVAARQLAAGPVANPD